MTTMELEAARAELARQILNTDNMEVLKKLKKYFIRITRVETSVQEKEDLTPYTLEEINGWIDEAEAEEAAGIEGTPHEEVMKRMRKRVAAL